MLVPLSLLKNYVKIELNEKEIWDKLAQAGLGTESIEEKDGDKIFDLEVTPNRPDWLSIIGVAREIASLKGEKVTLPKVKEIGKPKKILPLKIKTDFQINPRFSAIIISGVNVGESPKWLKDALEKVGQRSINNIVDITNFVMLETGNPLHAFDYDKIEGAQMSVELSREGEIFESVDSLKYHLPKGAVIIRDSQKIIDLCGIKGGKNSGTYNETKNILIRVPVENPTLIRKASSKLGLRSEASSIFEKAVDANGTIYALKRCVDLILEIAGGEVASEIYDLKEKEFKSWNIKVNKEKIIKYLGFEISNKDILDTLKKLNLEPVLKGESLETTIPTYRNDLKIEEDIIEEIARFYGYNNIQRKLPTGEIKTDKIFYFKDYSLQEKAKKILAACGFSEIKSYSLISESALDKNNINGKDVLRVDNPVSRDFEYLRPSLKAGLASGLEENLKITKKVNLFELGKIYRNVNKTADEQYFLSAVSNTLNFAQIKGILEKIYSEFGIRKDVSSLIEILGNGIFFELNFSEIEEKAKTQKIYKPIPKFPPIIEDLSVKLKDGKIEEILNEIKNIDPIIYAVSLLDEFEDNKTFHIIYLDKQKNLTKEDVSKIRKNIVKMLGEKFSASLN